MSSEEWVVGAIAWFVTNKMWSQWLSRELSYNKLFVCLNCGWLCVLKLTLLITGCILAGPKPYILITCHVLIVGKDILIFLWIYSMCQTFFYLWWILGALEYHGEPVVDFFSLWWEGWLQDLVEIFCVFHCFGPFNGEKFSTLWIKNLGLGMVVFFWHWWCLNGKQYFVVGLAPVDSEAHPTEDPSASAHLSMDGMEWVELFVREMTSASNIDDARARASRALEALEKSICTRAGAETAKSFNQVFYYSYQCFFLYSRPVFSDYYRWDILVGFVLRGFSACLPLHQENMMLKEQMQALIQENTILKRAVSIQHERQKEFEESSQELQQLKQLVSQYQDQLRTLEVELINSCMI